MAPTYRVLLALVLLGYAGAALSSPRLAGSGAQAGLHQRIGLFAALFSALIQCLPLSYFAGSAYWVKYHSDAAGAGPEWKKRHARWMKDRAYPVMFLSALSAFATAAVGAMADTGRIATGWHSALALISIGLCLLCMAWVPQLMRWNATLIRELVLRHPGPQPGSGEAANLRSRIRDMSVPPMFQLARILIFAALSVLGLRLYLRLGTDASRDLPRLPFAMIAGVMLALGLRWHQRHHPELHRPVSRAWLLGLALGAVYIATLAV